MKDIQLDARKTSDCKWTNSGLNQDIFSSSKPELSDCMETQSLKYEMQSLMAYVMNYRTYMMACVMEQPGPNIASHRFTAIIIVLWRPLPDTSCFTPVITCRAHQLFHVGMSSWFVVVQTWNRPLFVRTQTRLLTHLFPLPLPPQTTTNAAALITTVSKFASIMKASSPATVTPDASFSQTTSPALVSRVDS